ncbi:PKD domain-containing protein [Robertkochia solimangrovi]|uniref:PKD domain-containing protein n=1 Tax=Robertkochia solimangrovi TaxID=2213046 RepID=UPI0013A53D87|nr:PKD domain-containing protein [Robertkochia solimangrovi]
MSFDAYNLEGETLTNPTSLQFGPNGKLYVSQQMGIIWEMEVERQINAGVVSYQVVSKNSINLIQTLTPNHNDDGTIFTASTNRQITGIYVTGTANNPVIYATSSDYRIGGGSSLGRDLNLDTNSGVLSRLYWNGNSWEKTDLVRGLPRCEENHSTNGMTMFNKNGRTYMYIAQGGNTNMGAPSNNFAGSSETFLSGAILIVDITQLEQMETANGGPYTDQRTGTKFIYDLPTLNDPSRIDITSSDSRFPYPAGHPMRNATIDLGDPFGGNNGLNQAFPEAGGPVQIFSPGYRNAYDILVTAANKVFTFDNGPNSGWGGIPPIYNSAGNLKGGDLTTIYDPGSGDYVTNGFNVTTGITHGDQLHYIGTTTSANGSYYGGHPDPIRAFPLKAKIPNYVFSNGSWILSNEYDLSAMLINVRGYFDSSITTSDFTGDTRQGHYITDDINESSLNMLDIYNSSVNGLCEYTATNFSGAMQGDLLAASYNDGYILRYKPNASGTGLISKNTSFLSGFGSQPLDIIAQGDDDIFPGTIWAATYGASNITIFEPVDFIDCLLPGDTGYDPNADYDNDGYTNADEEANGTNICSAGSKPADNDGDGVSDLLDTDDDNDGIPDVSDAFAIDADNGLSTSLPIAYPFWNNDPGFGFLGLGFTGLMLDPSGNTDYLDQFDVNNMSFGGAAGKATVDFTTTGDAYGSANDQEYAFQFGIDVDQQTPVFTIHGRVETPFNNNAAVTGQSYGIFMGTGDQNNYLKVAVSTGTASGDGVNGIDIVKEVNGSPVKTSYDISGLISASTISLYLNVNPASLTVQALYSLNDGTTLIPVGSQQTVPASFFSQSDGAGLAVGIISTNGGSSPYTATWDYIDVFYNASGVLATDPTSLNFGQVDTNDTGSELAVTLTNQGGATDQSITVNGVSFSGANAGLFSSSTTFPLILGPGESAPVYVDLIPDGTVKSVSATMQFNHTGSNSPLAVAMTGQLVGEVSATSEIRINAGGGAITYNGKSFAADNFSDGGYSYTNSSANVPEMFKTERTSTSSPTGFNYNIPVSNGDYEVNLYFAEIYWNATGGGSGDGSTRIMDVSIEDILVLNDYSIIDDVGSETVVIKPFDVNVQDGVLNINFNSYWLNGGANQPKVSAIEVISKSVSSPTPISITNIPDRTDPVGAVIDMGVSASGGSSSENFTYSISGQPSGVVIEPTNGHISGTIGSAALSGGPSGNGVHQVTVTASKPSSQSDTESFSWAVTAASSGQWFLANENTSYIARHECSFVQAGNKFYLFGGRESAATLNVYDYTSDTWAALTNSAPKQFNHFQALEYQGLIWVVSAFQDNNYPTEQPAEFIWMFNPASQQWIQGPQIPAERRRGGAGLVIYNNKFYVVGGNTIGHNGGYVNWLDEFDPATGEWTVLPNAPHARDHFQAEVYNGKIYAIGGRLSGGTGGVFAPLVPEVDVYNIATGSWTTLAASKNLPTPRAAAANALFENKIYVMGGEVDYQTAAFEITEVFDPVTETWSDGPDMNNPRHGTQTIVSGPGIFIIAGSPNRGGGNQKNMEYFNQNSPQGNPSNASDLVLPDSQLFEVGSTKSVPLNVQNGNIGIWINSMALSGTNAASFNIINPLSNSLLASGTAYSVNISHTGSGANDTAQLVINYNNGTTDTVILQVEGGNNSGNTVNSLTLVNPNTNTDIVDLTNGSMIDLDLIASGVNIRANTNPAVVGSVVMNLSGTVTTSATESVAPYALFGDSNGNYNVGALPEGSYTLSAVPYTNSGGQGTAGTGLTIQFTVTGEIQLSAPVAVVAAVPTSGTAPLNVAFSSNGSFDDIGIVSYAWNFGDGGSSTAPNPSHNYLSAGNYTATLVVTDGDGLTDTEQIGISVTAPPVGDQVSSFNLINAQTDVVISTLSDGTVLGTDMYGSTPLSVAAITNPQQVGSVVMELSGPVNTSRVESVAPYALFGDNAGNYTGQVLPVGNYTLIATPYSSSGGGGTAGTPLTINFSMTEVTGLVAPDAQAAALPLSGTSPLSVSFSSAGSTDSDGTIVSYSWTFGDGGTSTEANPTHIYNAAGTYTTTLLITDNDGLTDAASVSINVTPTVSGNAVTSFTLINADTDTPITSLTNGMVIDATQVSGVGLNIEAVTSPSTVGSVKLKMTGALNAARTESGAPYTLYGDFQGNYYAQDFPTGNYTLTATPYSSSGGGGTAGQSLTLSFSIANPQIATKPIPTEASIEEEMIGVLGEDVVNLYPNPANDHVVISGLRYNPVDQQVFIYDLQGRVVSRHKSVNIFDGTNLKIPVRGLQQGVYILNVDEDGKTIFNKRLMIIH